LQRVLYKSTPSLPLLLECQGSERLLSDTTRAPKLIVLLHPATLGFKLSPLSTELPDVFSFQVVPEPIVFIPNPLPFRFPPHFSLAAPPLLPSGPFSPFSGVAVRFFQVADYFHKHLPSLPFLFLVSFRLNSPRPLSFPPNFA